MKERTNIIVNQLSLQQVIFGVMPNMCCLLNKIKTQTSLYLVNASANSGGEGMKQGDSVVVPI